MDVRKAAEEGIISLNQKYPGLPGIAKPYLLQALKHEDWRVRKSAAEVIVALAQASPELVGIAMPTLV